MFRPMRWALPAILLFPAFVRAADKPSALQRLPPPNLPSLLAGNTPEALAGSLRGYLVQSLPNPLYEASPGWGTTKEGIRGVKWKGLRPEVMRGLKNDGKWRKIRACPENLPNSLVLDIRNFQQTGPGRLTFDVFLSFDLKLHYEQQNWESGLRLYSGGARARLRLKLLMHCELVARLDDNGTFLPDAVFRLRVVRANLGYDNLVVEHIAGVGGEMAEMLGDAVKGGLHKWHPSLEAELLAKANAAIVKSGDSKEVRLTVGRIFDRLAPGNLPQ